MINEERSLRQALP